MASPIHYHNPYYTIPVIPTLLHTLHSYSTTYSYSCSTHSPTAFARNNLTIQTPHSIRREHGFMFSCISQTPICIHYNYQQSSVFTIQTLNNKHQQCIIHHTTSHDQMDCNKKGTSKISTNRHYTSLWHCI